MTALQRFGFKTRKDGSEVYRDAEKVVVIQPTAVRRLGWGYPVAPVGAEVFIISG